MKNNRESNFELMKIVSMLMIITGHFIVHGKLLEMTSGKTNILLTIIFMICVVHVNSFILITGYFQYKKEFKLSKAIQLNNSMWFYKVLFLIIFISLNLVEVTKIKMIQTLLPINYYDYWFIACYIFLYLLSPLLNIIIKNTNKIQHKNIIIGLFLVLSILSILTNNSAYNNSCGYSVGNFIMLYFIGSYMSKYDINLFKNKNRIKKILYLLIIFFLLVAVNYTIKYLAINNVNNTKELSKYFFEIISCGLYAYNSPLIIIQSIIYFMIFKNIKINCNKIINSIAGLTLGIYMIHDNEFVRGYMYTNIFNIVKPITTNTIVKLPLYILIVFIICAIIEYIRKKIFKLMYNLKISEKLRKYIKRIFEKREINW